MWSSSLILFGTVLILFPGPGCLFLFPGQGTFQLLCFQICFQSLSFFSSSGTPIMKILAHLILFQRELLNCPYSLNSTPVSSSLLIHSYISFSVLLIPVSLSFQLLYSLSLVGWSLFSNSLLKTSNFSVYPFFSQVLCLSLQSLP